MRQRDREKQKWTDRGDAARKTAGAIGGTATRRELGLV